MLARVGDAKAHRYCIEESLAAKVRADVKHQLVRALAQASAFEQRTVGAPVGVGVHALQGRARRTFEQEQLQPDAGARPGMRVR